jgi:hypothetical protein
MEKMNVTRAREVLNAPELPWTPDVKQALAQAYIDLTMANKMLEEQLDLVESERSELARRLHGGS